MLESHGFKLYSIDYEEKKVYVANLPAFAIAIGNNDYWQGGFGWKGWEWKEGKVSK